MTGYVLRRLLSALLTFVGITLLVFLLIHAIPGDPLSYYAAEAGSRGIAPGVQAQLRHEYGLDRPLPMQYVAWVGKVLTLDFGLSHAERRPVSSLIAEKLPNTLLLNAVAFLCAIAIAIPVGLLSAARPRRWLDRGSGLLFLLLYSLPGVWVALLLIELFAVRLQLLPLYGMRSDDGGTSAFADLAAHMVLPVVTLAYGQLAIFARISRTAVLEVLGRDYITTARAKGAGEARVLVRHAFRNAAIPLVTIGATVIPYLFSGSVIVENIFGWDGLGVLFYNGVLARDYPLVMGLTMLMAAATLLAYLAADLVYGVVDPRIRLSRGER